LSKRQKTLFNMLTTSEASKAWAIEVKPLRSANTTVQAS
jgi:hypothetical protein